MEDIARLEKRISDLEQHVAYQDATIQDLSDMTAQQWKIIDGLTKKATRLTEHLMALEESSKSATQQDPPPPHY